MSPSQPLLSPNETARRGDEIYENQVRQQVEPDHLGRIVAIDVLYKRRIRRGRLRIGCRRQTSAAPAQRRRMAGANRRTRSAPHRRPSYEEGLMILG